MKKAIFLKIFLGFVLVCIFLPLGLIFLWSFVGRWPWPNLMPETFSLRTLNQLFFGSENIGILLISSCFLSFVVAFLCTVIGILTARATEIYKIPIKHAVYFCSMLPLLIPAIVFAIGIQITFIYLGLTDTFLGVVFVHVIVALPYSIALMTDITRSLGIRYEEQANVLGAHPFRAFIEVSLPQLLPGLLSSFSMAFIISYSQYFTTLIVGGGQVKTIALVLVPYIQSGDRALGAIYSTAFTSTALFVFFFFESIIYRWQTQRGKYVS